MKATDIEQAVLNQLRILPIEKQQEVLDFVEFIGHKFGKKHPILVHLHNSNKNTHL